MKKTSFDINNFYNESSGGIHRRTRRRGGGGGRGAWLQPPIIFQITIFGQNIREIPLDFRASDGENHYSGKRPHPPPPKKKKKKKTGSVRQWRHYIACDSN